MAEANGHLLAPLDATHQGYKVGIWLKNQRATTRKTTKIEQRRRREPAGGLVGRRALAGAARATGGHRPLLVPSQGPVDWQRAFHLVWLHLEAGGGFPMGPGTVVHQGEDLGRWVKLVRFGWDKLTTVQ